jgi:hypothetical protein
MYTITELFEILRLNLSGNIIDREYLGKIKQDYLSVIKEKNNIQDNNIEFEKANKRLSDRIQDLISKNKELEHIIDSNKIPRTIPIEETKKWKFFSSF